MTGDEKVRKKKSKTKCHQVHYLTKTKLSEPCPGDLEFMFCGFKPASYFLGPSPCLFLKGEAALACHEGEGRYSLSAGRLRAESERSWFKSRLRPPTCCLTLNDFSWGPEPQILTHKGSFADCWGPRTRLDVSMARHRVMRPRQIVNTCSVLNA